jgi:hypothetical protein
MYKILSLDIARKARALLPQWTVRHVENNNFLPFFIQAHLN